MHEHPGSYPQRNQNLAVASRTVFLHGGARLLGLVACVHPSSIRMPARISVVYILLYVGNPSDKT